jgi:WD40 repeat protein/serine/threonine protein kinase
MTMNAACPGCGQLLPADAPQGRCPECLFDLLDEPEPARTGPASEVDAGTRTFGDYELLQEIGRGGMGVVYKARQISLGRIVAVKMLLGGQFAGKELVQRFRAEAGAAAALRHPNIVAIYDVGVHHGQHYFSMDYIEGQNLAQLVRNQPMSSRPAARYMKAVSEAVHFGHQHGVLHRDLKPANILVDSTTDQPLVTDFGLAKRLDSDSSLTLSGMVLGSPNFMPPEQASAPRGNIARESDVYSLGGILYYLLTGRPPFQSETLETTIQKVIHEEPISPRLLASSVPRDLETICLKCLEKNPPKRYSTAQALADELSRFLADEPIIAHPVSRTEKAWRWCRRKPALAASLSLILILLLIVIVGSPLAILRINRARETAELSLYAAEVNVAGQALEDGDLLRARTYLDRQRPGGSRKRDLRTFEWRYLDGEARSDEIATLGKHDGDVRTVRFSPDGKLLASGQKNGIVKLWDWRARQQLGTLQDVSIRSGKEEPRWFGSWASGLVFSRDGRLLAAGAAEKILLWDLPSRQRVGVLIGHTNYVNCLLFLPDGHTLASAASDGTVRFWEIASETPREIACVRANDREAFLLACSRDGKTLIASVRDSTLTRWDISNVGKPVQLPMLTAHEGWGLTFAMRPSSDVLVSPNGMKELILWELTNSPAALPFRRIPSSERPVGLPGAAVFTPDGATLVLGGQDRNLTIWDFVGPKKSIQLKGHADAINSVDVSPDGSTVASGSNDGTVRLWDISNCWNEKPSVTHTDWLESVIVSPDSKYVGSGSQNALFKLLEVESGQVVASVHPTNTYGAHRCSFSPDSRLIAVETRDFIRLRKVPSLEEVESFPGSSPRFASDRSTLIYFRKKGDHGEFQWRNPDSTIERTIPVDWRWILQLAVSPDGRKIAASQGGDLRFWRVEDPKTAIPLGPFLDDVRGVSFSSDGALLACSSWDSTVALYRVSEKPSLISRWTAHRGFALSVAFSADNRTLATGGDDGAIRFWNLNSLQESLVLHAGNAMVECLAFSPDGNHLASGDGDGFVRLWHARPVQ